MFDLSNPLNEIVKIELIRCFEKISGCSGWLIIQNANGLITACLNTSNELTAKKIKERIEGTKIAKTIVVSKQDAPDQWVVECNNLNVQTLFYQGSTLLKATESSEANRHLFESLLLELLTTLHSASEKIEVGAAGALKAEGILKISPDVKKQVDHHIASQTLHIHLKDHPTLSVLKIKKFHPAERRGFAKLPEWSIVLENKTGLKNKAGKREYECYFTDKSLTTLISRLQDAALKLNLVEFTLSKGMLCALDKRKPPNPSTYWDCDWDNNDGAGLYYNKISDPHIIDAFSCEVLSNIPEVKIDKPLRILDIGAGKGRLAYKLIQLLEGLSIPYHYIFVEPSLKQISIAAANLAKYKNNISFVNTTIGALEIVDKVHCVVSSGGPLNLDIVTREQAIENAKKMQQMLLPDGILIASGQTALLVKRKHFSLEPVSCSVPCVIPPELEENPYLKQVRYIGTFFNQFQQYVLRNSVKKKSYEGDSATSDAAAAGP